MIIIQPSATRTTNPRAPIPSSELLGYYHSSALRTDNPLLFGQSQVLQIVQSTGPPDAVVPEPNRSSSFGLGSNQPGWTHYNFAVRG